jgi:hypothetical protein
MGGLRIPQYGTLTRVASDRPSEIERSFYCNGDQQINGRILSCIRLE